jgi:hypothetical protein
VFQESTAGVSIQTEQAPGFMQSDIVSQAMGAKLSFANCLRVAALRSQGTTLSDELYKWLIELYLKHGIPSKEEFDEALKEFAQTEKPNKPRAEPESEQKSPDGNLHWDQGLSCIGLFCVFLVAVMYYGLQDDKTHEGQDSWQDWDSKDKKE